MLFGTERPSYFMLLLSIIRFFFFSVLVEDLTDGRELASRAISPHFWLEKDVNSLQSPASRIASIYLPGPTESIRYFLFSLRTGRADSCITAVHRALDLFLPVLVCKRCPVWLLTPHSDVLAPLRGEVLLSFLFSYPFISAHWGFVPPARWVFFCTRSFGHRCVRDTGSACPAVKCTFSLLARKADYFPLQWFCNQYLFSSNYLLVSFFHLC